MIELSLMQKNRAKEILGEIPILLEHGSYNTAVNRSYYAAFHMLKALEVLNLFDSKKHSGVISYFRASYIKTGVFPEELSDIIGSLQDAREDSDYNIVVLFDEETADGLYRESLRFCRVIEQYLSEQYTNR